MSINDIDTARYENLFLEIDPENIARKISLNHQSVFTQFAFPEQINSEKQYFEQIGFLYAHLCRGTNRVVPLNIECVEKAREYLRDEAEAYKRSVQGIGNAFYDVCNLIYEKFHQESVIAYVRAKVRIFIHSNYEDKERFAHYFCDTRTNYSEKEKKQVSLKIASNIDEFAVFYVDMLESNRHI